MKKVAVLALSILAVSAQAVDLNLGGYSSNFDDVTPTGTTLTAVPGWSIWSFAGSSSSWNTNAGVPLGELSGGTQIDNSVSPLTIWNQGMSSTTAINGTNVQWSASNLNNRGIGTGPTGVAGSGIQLDLTNNTGVSISSLTVTYDTQVMFAGSSSGSSIDLNGYRFFASTTGATGTWFAVTGLDTTTAGTDAPGTMYNASLTFNLGSSVANKGNILLRWIDDNNNPSPDQGIAIDNVRVTTSAVPEPATMLALAIGVVGTIARKRRSK